MGWCWGRVVDVFVVLCCPENVQVKILKSVPQVPMNSIVVNLPLVGGFFPQAPGQQQKYLGEYLETQIKKNLTTKRFSFSEK